MTQPMQPSLRPVRLPEAVLEAFFPAPALLAGRPAASSVAIYTRDCTAYVAFCGDDSTLALCTETLRCWRTYLVQNIPVSPPTMNRMLAAVKRVMKEGLLVLLLNSMRRVSRLVRSARCWRLDTERRGIMSSDVKKAQAWYRVTGRVQIRGRHGFL